MAGSSKDVNGSLAGLWTWALDASQYRVLVSHNDLCVRRSRLSAIGRLTVLREHGIRIDRCRHTLTLRMQCNQLLIRHLIDLVHLCLSIRRNELFYNHEATTDTDHKFAVQDLCVDFLGTEQVETVSNLPDWNRAVGLIDVMAKHLV